MKFTKQELNTLYQIILNEMGNVTRKTPVGYIDILQNLELKIYKDFKKYEDISNRQKTTQCYTKE